MDYETQREINRLKSRVQQLEMDLEAEHKHNRTLFARFNERLEAMEGGKRKNKKGAAAEWSETKYAPGKISAPVFEHITAGAIVGTKKQQFEPLTLNSIPHPREKPIVSIAKREPVKQEPKKTFAEEYNDIALGASGEAFAAKYSLRFFGCANVGVRINRPEAAPIFTDAPSAAKGDFWAMPLKGDQFAVMPNPLIPYDATRHKSAGMLEAFSSNYRGGTFRHIKLVRPAVFSASGYVWKLLNRGEILLS